MNDSEWEMVLLEGVPEPFRTFLCAHRWEILKSERTVDYLRGGERCYALAFLSSDSEKGRIVYFLDFGPNYRLWDAATRLIGFWHFQVAEIKDPPYFQRKVGFDPLAPIDWSKVVMVTDTAVG